MKAHDRLLSIDAVRGTAMFFVGISHISYYVLLSAPHLSALLRALGFFATPNFLLLSGLACGYQLAKTDSAGAALRIVDRGIFVLLIGHCLIAGSIAYIVRPGTMFEHIVITDNIGLLLCTAPLLRYVAPRDLLQAGAGLFAVSAAVSHLWRPATVAGAAIAGPLLGINARILPDNGWISPTLSFAGLFLMGVGTGKLINRLQRQQRTSTAWKALFVSGVASVAVATALNVGRHFIKSPLLEHFGSNIWTDAFLAMLDVRHKSPPTIAYALFYGGIGVALVGLIGLLPRSGAGRLTGIVQPAVATVATIGRASFVSYVCLQWLVDFTPRFLGFDAALAAPTASLGYLFLISVIVFLVARTWDRHGGNRWLTVGLRPLLEHRWIGFPQEVRACSRHARAFAQQATILARARLAAIKPKHVAGDR